MPRVLMMMMMMAECGVMVHAARFNMLYFAIIVWARTGKPPTRGGDEP